MQDAPAYEVLVVVPAAGAPLQPALDFAAQPRQAGLAASGDDLVAWERPAGGVSVLLPAVRLNATRDLAPCGAPSARSVCLPSVPHSTGLIRQQTGVSLFGHALYRAVVPGVERLRQLRCLLRAAFATKCTNNFCFAPDERRLVVHLDLSDHQVSPQL
jgi:hypothetical protein